MTTVIAGLSAVATGIRHDIAVPGLTPGLLMAIVLTPLWLPHVVRSAAVRWVVLIGGGAIAWGLVVALFNDNNAYDPRTLVFQVVLAVSVIGCGCLLIWVQSVIGTSWTVLLFGIGALVRVAMNGANPVNPWKYSWAVPVTIALLGAALIAGSRLLEFIVLIIVAGISATSDSRSMSAFLIITAALVTWQLARRGGRSLNRGALAAALVLGGLGGYNLFQTLILNGVLGEDAAQRTQAQLDATGSLLTGGRPELGASQALLEARPQGFGPGAIPTANDVVLAKSGMSDLNYDANNGYVEVFMFGGRFELHSVIGDFWIWLGPLGALLIVLLVAIAVRALIEAIAGNRASAAMCLLTILGLWDAAFSPVLTSYHTMTLMWAIAVTSLAQSASRARAVESGPSPSAHDAEGVEVEAGRGDGRD
ncbi:hypothetical protein [Aeromicrobium duanguangcaii]|uniref:hypothetical protein n=1 Tax=Aeromicrobium duanguangcaii TaxID=2968086 RepID=UPI002018221D|nr:hypothetical protein [Aeromicrobium duanguangcaii]MCL3839191.1 hypothetical protein [Aeromicrobium duanguangcaii]